MGRNCIVNDVVFDTLIRKPYEKQRHNFRHISNAKFFEVIAKHGAIHTSLVYESISCSNYQRLLCFGSVRSVLRIWISISFSNQYVRRWILATESNVSVF